MQILHNEVLGYFRIVSCSIDKFLNSEIVHTSNHHVYCLNIHKYYAANVHVGTCSFKCHALYSMVIGVNLNGIIL